MASSCQLTTWVEPGPVVADTCLILSVWQCESGRKKGGKCFVMAERVGFVPEVPASLND